MRVGVIVNPNSRRNRKRRGRCKKLQAAIGNVGLVVQTPDIDSIVPAVVELLDKGCDILVADGGDGALHWLMHGLRTVRAERGGSFGGSPYPLLMPTNGGTINALASNVGLRGSSVAILKRLRRHLLSGDVLPLTRVESMTIELRYAAPDLATETYRSETISGFAVAVAGLSQRFFEKYYESDDPSPSEIIRVVARVVTSVAAGQLPAGAVKDPKLARYARGFFDAVPATVTVDGECYSRTEWTAINVASMSLNLGDVMRLFGDGDRPGQMQALFGAPSSWVMIRNLPRMYLGHPLRGSNIVDRTCRELTVEARGDELLAPVVDGEYYRDVRCVSFRIGDAIHVPVVK